MTFFGGVRGGIGKAAAEDALFVVGVEAETVAEEEEGIVLVWECGVETGLEVCDLRHGCWAFEEDAGGGEAVLFQVGPSCAVNGVLFPQG